MSYLSKSPRVLSQQLKVQELLIKYSEDANLYAVDGSDIIVFIDEAVANIKMAMMADNSAPGLVLIPAASLSIVDSSAYTAGGDKKAIKLASVTLAANDVLVLKYILEE